jgi:glycosyltransferase involved in cell wall biosynthesis
LPSGADIALFQKALSPALKVPPELEHLPGPVIGFVGAMINMRMHWEWIREAVVARPQWYFVFIGPCLDGPPPPDIAAQRNVAFLGSRPVEAIPAYLKGLDVCLIPYKGDEFVKACSPTKTFEYLAAGKPVVSSWIPDLEAYQHVIRLSRNADEFIRHIEAALVDGKKAAMVQEYVRVAHGQTWDNRVETASRLIASLVPLS